MKKISKGNEFCLNETSGLSRKKFGYKKLVGNCEDFNPKDKYLNILAKFITHTTKFYEKFLDYEIAPGSFNDFLKRELPPGAFEEFFDLDLSNFSEKELDSKIPSGYTYLGQFIDHDISFDSQSDRFKPTHRPWGKINPDKIFNLRSPFFDLETIYGSEYPSNAGEIPRCCLMEENSRTRLKLGNTFADPFGSNCKTERPYPNDLLRKADGVTANIVDPRNDENFLVAQIQVAFTKFHNAVVKKIGNSNTAVTFNKARKITIRHYQHIILKDFLPKIIKKSVLEDVKAEVLAGKNKFYHPTRRNMFIPLEYSVAAFRAGHSMIRNSYNLNYSHSDFSIGELTLLTGFGKMNGKKGLSSIWLIDWNLFYDINNSSQTNPRFNFAKKINTEFSSALGILRPGVGAVRGNSLSALDLYRGRALGLPTGQLVAEIVAKKTDSEVLSVKQIEDKLPNSLKNVLREKTPLLFYLLAEAEEQTNGNTLGDVGSRIVAETIVTLLYHSPFSILKKELENDENFLAEDKVTFGMPEMLQFIASANEGDFDELNPVG